jgi:signal transduction histidine kinase
LVQVLSNLVINSYLHAFNEGARPGKIRIAVAIEADDRLRINYSDDGAGMPPETLVHLFEPFFTTRRGKGGSGLGMYIVYNLVTQVLRGSIQCESGPGKGMHCVIKFSVQRASAASHA